ncbi:hypothetical protein RJ639_031392 [Escallonia herrerae]|uniref:CHCH domain-containing protein n=1 Tax=Escallonia herrerae TaxID=1293975 RepID=A0AA89BNP0_9ASTE|nr:hypothetical protein RJ639_031392 [Escallonia herrerae]
MPRSRGRSGAATARAPAPTKAAPVPPPAPVQGGLGSTIAEGMAFGGGSAIAHRAVDALVGPRVVKHENVTSPVPSAEPADACARQNNAFQDCLNQYGSDISNCQFYMDMLSECRRSSTSNGLIV